MGLVVVDASWSNGIGTVLRLALKIFYCGLVWYSRYVTSEYYLDALPTYDYCHSLLILLFESS